MRKLIVQVQMSIDGFAAGPNNEGDWVFSSGPDAAGFQKVIDIAGTCDTLLLGRKMSREFIDHWENFADSAAATPQKTLGELIVAMRKIVITTTEKSVSGKNVEVENGDLTTAVNALKNQPGKDILVYGGVELVSSLISLNLVDEYYFFICPIALGKGKPVFKEKKMLKLESSTAYGNGKVLNKYLPI